MQPQKNARLTVEGRLEMVRSVLDDGGTIRSAAIAHGVSLSTARKWIARYRAGGTDALYDRTSRPGAMPRATSEARKLRIIELRRLGLRMKDIAREIGCSASTVSRVSRARSTLTQTTCCNNSTGGS